MKKKNNKKHIDVTARTHSNSNTDEARLLLNAVVIPYFFFFFYTPIRVEIAFFFFFLVSLSYYCYHLRVPGAIFYFRLSYDNNKKKKKRNTLYFEYYVFILCDAKKILPTIVSSILFATSCTRSGRATHLLCRVDIVNVLFVMFWHPPNPSALEQLPLIALYTSNTPPGA